MLVPLCLTLAALPVAAPAPLLVPGSRGHVALAHGVLSAPLAGDLRDAARTFALARRNELGLPAEATLGRGEAFGSRFGATVRLPQEVLGTGVHGASVVVTFDALRRVVRLASSVADLPVADPRWVLGGAQALALAAKEVDGALLKPDGAPYGGWRRQVFSDGSALRTGYLVWVPTVKLHQNWHLAVDAVTGQVLWAQDRTHSSTEAQVYATSPGGLDAGVGLTPTVPVTLGHFAADYDGGFLNGARIRVYNCCPTLGCDTDAGAAPRRSTGTVQTFGGSYSYDVAICDRVQLATNDPALNPDASYVYLPVDPPTTTTPRISSKADWDEFAEVHGYYHVNKVYDVIRDLSTGPFATDAGVAAFSLRDNRSGKRAAVQVNFNEPDFQAATQNGQGVYVSNVMQRMSNAYFMPRESMQAVTVPEQAFDTDALVFYQGDEADFSYDAPVFWHEFGHGMIYSTANWEHVVNLDARSANAESSALHEGVADVIAFMTGNDPMLGGYVGSRAEPDAGVLRNADNTWRCPEVLWGESHQDSQHFAGAIWQARTTFFQGTDSGKTFDAAFYAAVISFPQDVNFENAAAIVSASVGMAFPQMADAEAKMKSVFDARGVSNCSKVLDVTNDRTPREMYIVPGTASVLVNDGSKVPGPHQFKFQLPRGAREVSISGPYFSFGGGTLPDGGSSMRLQLLAKANAPITFTRQGGVLTNDSDVSAIPTTPIQGQMVGRAAIQVACGGEVYFTVVNTSRRDRALYNLGVGYEPLNDCSDVDAGSDAGEPDAGPPPPQDVLVPMAQDGLGAVPQGCGCSSGGVLGALAVLLLVPAVRRRRRDRR